MGGAMGSGLGGEGASYRFEPGGKNEENSKDS